MARRGSATRLSVFVLIAALLVLTVGCSVEVGSNPGAGSEADGLNQKLSNISREIEAEYGAGEVAVRTDEGLFGSSLTFEVFDSELNDLSRGEQEKAAREVASFAHGELSDSDRFGDYEVKLYEGQASEDTQVAEYTFPADDL